MSGRTGKSTVSNSFPAFLQYWQKRYQLDAILLRWAIVPEWCRYRFFYDAAVFLYSDIERNDTKNFREKKILRVALSGSGVY
jgi:hypothetical protein